MVIGTGDMSELALGWATYNGDHMSMYGVNCFSAEDVGPLSGASLCRDDARIPVRLHRCSVGYSGYPGQLRNCCLPPTATARLPRRRKIWSVLMNCTTFILYYLMRFGYAPSEDLSSCSAIRLRDAYRRMKQSKNGSRRLYRRFFCPAV